MLDIKIQCAKLDAMKKEDAKKLFGGTLQTMGKAIGRTKSAISQWPDELTEDQNNIVVGAAVRKGIHVPKELIHG